MAIDSSDEPRPSTSFDKSEFETDNGKDPNVYEDDEMWV